MSMNRYQIIKSPVITERSTLLREKNNQYVFRVDPGATKLEIKQAITELFKVDVEAVRTSNFSGKFRRLAAGRPEGKRADWKKAIVTLKKGQEIKVEPEQNQ